MEKKVLENKSKVRSCYNCTWAHFVPTSNLPGWISIQWGGGKYYRCYSLGKNKLYKSKYKKLHGIDSEGDKYMLLPINYADGREDGRSNPEGTYAPCKFFEVQLRRGLDRTLDAILGTGSGRHRYNEVRFDRDRLKDRRKK